MGADYLIRFGGADLFARRVRRRGGASSPNRGMPRVRSARELAN